jgi:hypothetical protein
MDRQIDNQVLRYAYVRAIPIKGNTAQWRVTVKVIG